MQIELVFGDSQVMIADEFPEDSGALTHQDSRRNPRRATPGDRGRVGTAAGLLRRLEARPVRASGEMGRVSSSMRKSRQCTALGELSCVCEGSRCRRGLRSRHSCTE
jgi:hypothetical protein